MASKTRQAPSHRQPPSSTRPSAVKGTPSASSIARWTPGPNAGVVEPSARTTRWQGTLGVRPVRKEEA